MPGVLSILPSHMTYKLLEPDGDKQTEPHAGGIKNTLGNHKTNGKEQIWCRNEREDHQRKALPTQHTSQSYDEVSQ